MNDAERLELPHIIDAGENSLWDEVRGRGGYYDRSGNPISFRDWARLDAWDREKNEHRYKVVKQEYVEHYWISTVWLGLDHSYIDGPPLIFETMVFNHDTNESDLDCERYSTEQQAIEGHARIVEKVRLIVEATRKETDTEPN